MSFLVRLSPYISIVIVTKWLNLDELLTVKCYFGHKIFNFDFVEQAVKKTIVRYFSVSEKFFPGSVTFLKILCNCGYDGAERGGSIRFCSNHYISIFKLTPNDFINFKLLCNGLENIVFTRFGKEWVELICTILQICENLKRVQITIFEEGIDILCNTVIAYCPNITSINVSGCCYLSEHVAIHMCQYCVDLAELDVSNCRNLSKDFVNAVTIHCKSLTSLNIQGCRLIYKNDMMVLGCFPQCKIQTLQSYCVLTNFSFKLYMNESGSHLRTLDLNCNCETISEKMIYLLSTNICPNLEELSLSNGIHVDQYEIRFMTTNFSKLKKLHLRNVSGVTYQTINDIGNNLYRLTDLNLSYGIGSFYALPEFYDPKKTNPSYIDRGLESLALCTKLKYLRLLGDYCISIHVLMNIAVSCSELTRILFDSYFAQYSLLQSELYQHLPNLSNFNVTDEMISDDVFSALSKHCKMLVDVNIKKCFVTDNGIDMLVSSCIFIEHLHLGHCIGLTHLSIDSVRKYARNLKTFYHSVPNIDEQSLHIGCRKLKHHMMGKECYVHVEENYPFEMDERMLDFYDVY